MKRDEQAVQTFLADSPAEKDLKTAEKEIAEAFDRLKAKSEEVCKLYADDLKAMEDYFAEFAENPVFRGTYANRIEEKKEAETAVQIALYAHLCRIRDNEAVGELSALQKSIPVDMVGEIENEKDPEAAWSALNEKFERDSETMSEAARCKRTFREARAKKEKKINRVSAVIFFACLVVGVAVFLLVSQTGANMLGFSRGLISESGSFLLLFGTIIAGAVAAVLIRLPSQKLARQSQTAFESALLESYYHDYYLPKTKFLRQKAGEVIPSVQKAQDLDAESLRAYRRLTEFVPNDLKNLSGLNYVSKALSENRADTLREAYDFAERKLGEERRDAAEAEHRGRILASQLAQEQEARRQAEYAKEQAEELKRQTYYAKETAAAAKEQAERAKETAEAARKAAETAEEIRRGY